DKDIQGCVCLRDEAALAVAQVKLAFWPVHKDCPTFGADYEWRWHDRSKHGTVPSAPARLHWIARAAAIELLRAFAQAEHGPFGAEGERSVGVAVEGQLLHQLSVRAPN